MEDGQPHPHGHGKARPSRRTQLCSACELNSDLRQRLDKTRNELRTLRTQQAAEKTTRELDRMRELSERHARELSDQQARKLSQRKVRILIL